MQPKHTRQGESKQELNSWLNGRAATPARDRENKQKTVDRTLHTASHEPPAMVIDTVRQGPYIDQTGDSHTTPARNPDGTRQKGSKAERSLLQRLVEDKIAQRRTGFPDFAILDGPDGVPIGFIEVKRGPRDHRRFDQVAFQRFCERFNVPYLLWWPGVALPEWVTEVANRRYGSPVLINGETVSVPKRTGGRVARRMQHIAFQGPISALV